VKERTAELVKANERLKREIEERKQAEEALKEAHDELEARVKVRTAELTRATERLNAELAERKRTEEALREREKELETKTSNLEEVNTALKVLLEQRDNDKEALKDKVLSNVNELIMPYVEKLKKDHLNPRQDTIVNILESNLMDIVSEFPLRLSSKFLSLTPQEIRIADLVKQGKTTKEMAELFRVSIKTIESHRDNIREKIGIKNKKANLRSYLASFSKP
jgi:DNA-binding CsgD family transcriptional regulator